MRRPSATEFSSLIQVLREDHGNRFGELDELAMSLANCIKAKNQSGELALRERPIDQPHAGRVIVDGVLSVGHKYTASVSRAVQRIVAFPEAESVSGFRALIDLKGSKEVIGWKEGPVQDSLLIVADFFSMNSVDTYDQMVAWLKPMRNRDLLLHATDGNKIGAFKPGDKTADYFRVLVTHWDAVAVDTSIKSFLAECGILPRYSTVQYAIKRAIVQLAALKLEMWPVDLDWCLWSYQPIGIKNVPSGMGEIPASKYCIHCGRAIPGVSRFCPNCGAKQH